MCTGNWANAATWSPSGIPACGDSIIINPGDTVNLTTQQNYSSCMQSLKIIVKGMIWFHNGSKLRLPCGSYMLIYPGGSLQPDVGLANSNYIEICGTVYWNSNNPMYGPACLPPTHPFCQSILPVELTSFKAEICNINMVCLRWETATENNNDNYEIERSQDGINFRTISSINSQAPGGYSQQKLNYFIIDESPLNGINYYRLKQVDKNNSFVRSNTIAVQTILENGIQYLIYPNSNAGEFTVDISGLRNERNIRLLLRSSKGSIVYKASYFIEEASAQIRVVPEPKLANGIYFCSLIVGDKEYRVKIIVMNS